MTEKMEKRLRKFLKEECSKRNLVAIVQEINSYNGALDFVAVYDMDSFDEMNEGKEPWEIARGCFFGNFNPTHEYWRYYGCGNFESLSNYDMECELLDSISDILSAIDETPYQYLPSDIQAVYDEMSAEEDEEE